MGCFCKGRCQLILVLGLCFVLLGCFTIRMDNADLRLFVYPQNYVQTMSSTPGIRISAEYPGKVDKVQYSTVEGSFLTWNSSIGSITGCGQYVKLPYDRIIYWTPSWDNTMPEVMNKICIKVGILDENETLLAEKEITILYNGLYTVHVSPGIVIGVNS